VILLLVGSDSYADNQEEISIKSAFMLKMTHFINWPEGSKVREENKSIFRLCLEHGHELSSTLTQWAKTGKIKNKTVEIKYISTVSATADSCDILYITKKKFLHDFVAHSKDIDILTISDLAGGASSGSIINFIKIDDKVRFEINLEKGENSGFKFSPRLLRLAKIVKGSQ